MSRFCSSSAVVIGTHGPYIIRAPQSLAIHVPVHKRIANEQQNSVLKIDGICIDQTSLAERSSQVALMSVIFRAAERVVVRGDGATAQSIRLLTSIGAFDGIRSANPNPNELRILLALAGGLKVQKLCNEQQRHKFGLSRDPCLW
ncbi:hypothetical protein MYCTH_2126094 [Thermothelomyces thermophilus ATCC 42464]|uniref:Heterokaryon incompatibility domain-containing protein n=1 Tax=Thermothelomyces thermophilus (strain ATCC 42464 / BCRC 31852 / DSM 1799) TaxID=573729 RepID=G2Q8R0_THET4|nr:uncharacterized protein MYCTH_2126094 [Thermothelomyces thermophilus ATCC 42464]AEO57109.1 hypothetical protein MYCTH_2126094 [Thermothelomyces thermophilus ATCC 42464]